MSDKVIIHIISPEQHICQIVAGFENLFGNSVIVENHLSDPSYDGHRGAYLIVLYKSSKLVYDMTDGFHDLGTINWHLQNCDYYFKRSYSQERIQSLLPSLAYKIRPTGLWYQVSPRSYPFPLTFRERLLNLIGIKSYSWFTQEKFEEIPKYKPNNLRILFFTRLWEPTLNDEDLNSERNLINNMRISLIRELKKIFGNSFYGGLYDMELSRKLAPDLVLPKYRTIKNNYLELMHKCDICIGSMGLHQSIGGKTGEYVAASKAIINEKLHYEVTGNFSDGVNYFSFNSIDECIKSVDYLYHSPKQVFEMKMANLKYYSEFLEPTILVRKTLENVNLF